VRTIDIDDVERQRDAGEPLRLGDQLLGQKGRRHRVENMDRVKRDRPRAPQPARRERLRAGAGRGFRLRCERCLQCSAVVKVTMERRARDAGGGSDVGEARRCRLCEKPRCRFDNALVISLGVSSTLAHFGGATTWPN
jgi:hypothetical protein